MNTDLTRRSLLRRTIAAGGLLGAGAVSPFGVVTRPARAASAARVQADSRVSTSRRFARWVTGLRYDDLPPAVVDRAQGVTLHAMASALLGSQLPAGRQAIDLITQDEAGFPRGGTLLVTGTRATKAGAVFANAEMILAGGKWDTFRMLTHPGTCIVPAALVAAEAEAASGEDFLAGLVAGYEVMERMAADVIPTMMTRGFHAGPVFGIFGATVAAGKIMGLTEDQMTNAIGLSVNLAAGNLESRGLRESAAARNALLAVALARQGRTAGETALEGEAGFYHAYLGNNRGQLTHSFVGDTKTDLGLITAGLGDEWLFLETLYRIYSTAGYNIPHVDVTAQLCAEQNISYADVDRVEAVVNWLETQYPSPAFPTRREDIGTATRGSTRYYTAYGVVRRGFPLLADVPDPPEVLDLMNRVTIIPSHEMTLFGPRITIFTKDGRNYTKQATGREFIWDFDEEARRIRDVVPGLPISAARFEDLIAVCGDLDRADRADRLIQLTVA
ncbi:MAG: MmgE/PrpD family protein [Acidobacteriota bacterium]|nr:MmgE/PrpD family protein [Acidobacteriota bacterium]